MKTLAVFATVPRGEHSRHRDSGRGVAVVIARSSCPHFLAWMGVPHPAVRIVVPLQCHFLENAVLPVQICAIVMIVCSAFAESLDSS